MATKLRDPGTITFSATMLGAGGGGAYVEFPFSVEERFGTKGRVPIVATIDGIEYRGSISNMGGGCHILIVLKEIRQKLGKAPGDEVEVSLRLDSAPRTIQLPDDVQSVLRQDADALAVYNRLSYTHQREYITWIEDAKKAETRERRIHKMLEMLKEEKKAP